MMLAVAIRFDVIWFVRNQVVHGKVKLSPDEMIGSVKRRYDEHQWAWQTQRRENEEIWKPPDHGKLKVNCDVALSRGILYIAVICHNDLGEVIQVKTSSTLGSSPVKDEARAARLACQLETEVPFNIVIIKGDYLNLVEQVSLVLDWEIDGEVTTIRILLQEHEGWSFIWTPHEANFAAHNLAHWCRSGSVMGNIFPMELPSHVLDCDHAAHRSLPC